MRTSLDTNVISALWSNERSAPNIVNLLDNEVGEDSVLISAPVYTELLAYPGMTPGELSSFLGTYEAQVDYALAQEVWLEAGLRYAAYAKRRRLAGGQQPRRIIADFLIGAHALFKADRLMTLDADLYRRDFPELALLVPEAVN